jgi:hypothetical protein
MDINVRTSNLSRPESTSPTEDASADAPGVDVSGGGEDSVMISTHLRTRGPLCSCEQIGVSGGNGYQSTRMGVFTRSQTLANSRWVYKNANDE